jgi:hypothetical protein
MDSGQVKFLPDSFLGKLLQEFGIQWTHLAILSGVVFSSFHLEQYLNPGLWMLGTLAAFSLVYLFRDYISKNFLVVSIWAALSGLILLLVPLAVLFGLGQDIPAFIRQWSQAATIYLSLAIGVPAGSMILAYRNKDEFLRTPLPPQLAEAAKEAASHSDFIHESVSYQIELLPTPAKEVVMRFTVTMNVVNRAKRKTIYQDFFDPAGRYSKMHYATIKQQSINTEDPDRSFKRGLLLTHEAEPNERFEVVVSGESTFYGRDSELVGVYLPCNSLTVRIKKPPPNLSVNIQSLLPKKIDSKPQPDGDILFEYADGVLPFQGTRVFWEPRDHQ